MSVGDAFNLGATTFAALHNDLRLAKELLDAIMVPAGAGPIRIKIEADGSRLIYERGEPGQAEITTTTASTT